MAIHYSDYLTGDDATLDGTNPATPYQTITAASVGLSGGDEVRVAKSPADTALTGTLGFTEDNTAVTGSGTLFTTELAVGDFVKGGDGQYYEVVTITDNTNAVLFKEYPSATESGVTGYKLGVTSTGAAAATSTQVQVISASGTSVASRLKISGGWDLTGPTQDGQTYFRQMHGTFNNRYGYGLYASSKDFIEIERLHFLRYYRCMYINECDFWKLTSPNLLSGGDAALYLYNSYSCEFISAVINSSANRGTHILGSANTTFTDLICCSNQNFNFVIQTNSNNCTTTGATFKSSPCGAYISDCLYNTFSNITAENCIYGMYLIGSANNVITNPVLNNNNTGVYSGGGSNNVVNNFTGTGNGTDVNLVSPKYYSEYPAIKIQHFKTTGDNRCYYEFGETYRDTTDARSTQCLRYDPSSATYYITQSFFFKADSGVAQTLSAYVKDDASFNGDIQAAIYFMEEKITGWSEWTPSTSYAQKTIVASAVDITEDGVLELRIKVRGTAGNVFVDDLATA